MNIIFCPLTSRIIWLLRSMDSLKTCSLLQTCLCPTQKEMNWNDFNYHKKGLEFSLLYTSTPNRSTRRSSLRKVQGHRHLTATRNACPRHWGARWANTPLWEDALHRSSHSAHSARRKRGQERSCMEHSIAAVQACTEKRVAIIAYSYLARHNAKCSTWSKSVKALDKPRRKILH